MRIIGCLAARAVAFDSRIKAHILNGGSLASLKHISARFGSRLNRLGKNDTAYDEQIYEYILNSSNVKTNENWDVQQGLYTIDTGCFQNGLFRQILQCFCLFRSNSYSYLDRQCNWRQFFRDQPLYMFQALQEKHEVARHVVTYGRSCWLSRSSEYILIIKSPMWQRLPLSYSMFFFV